IYYLFWTVIVDTIKVVVRPAVLDNNTSWQVFENDQQIVNFLQEEAEFSARNQDKLEQQY
ncbi:hypothetical protein KI387_025916, partial [Taxus chinensis]